MYFCKDEIEFLTWFFKSGMQNQEVFFTVIIAIAFQN